MEFFVFLLFILIVLLILVLRYSLLDKMDRLEQEVRHLREELGRREEVGRTEGVAAAVRTGPEGQGGAREEGAVPGGTKQEVPKGEKVAMQASGGSGSGTKGGQEAGSGEGRKMRANEEPTDWEKFIGENLISKIGIGILVLAIGFFVKYAIDNDWIGPVGRVGIGLLCGAILIGLAHRLRNQYKAFSSVLIGGGLAVLYFTIALAYHQYQLFSQTTAFILMLVITAYSVVLSLLYNREELAIIALVGGFVTPFLVSNGSRDYKILFTYLLILNTGLLVIAYYKAWRLLNGLAFGFTVVLFGSWLAGVGGNAGGPGLAGGPAVGGNAGVAGHAELSGNQENILRSEYYGGFGFATAFYGLFFVVNVARTIREKKKFIATDFLILLLNTCLYFGVSLYFISQLGLERYRGLYCAIMGVIHIVLSWLLFRRQSVDKNILYLLIGITLSFVSLTAPLQLHGHYITLFWATEAVLLYWLFQQSKLRLIGLASWLVLAAMIVSLAWDWVNIYVLGYPGMAIIFNKGYMTGLYCAVCCFVLFRLQREAVVRLVMLTGGAALLFISGALETGYQFSYRYPRLDIGSFYLLLYTFVFILVFTSLSGRLRAINLRVLNMVLMGVGLLVYLLSLPAVFGLQEEMLEQRLYQSHFVAHWIGAVVILSILYRLTGLYRAGNWKVEAAVFAWMVAGIAVIFLSAEGQMLVNMLYYSREHPLDELQRVYEKTGLPILWGLCSFVCMWLGMRHKFRPLRIFSLVLFTITLLKLFLFDIQNIPIAGKIAAFFCLGVLLLVVSFMYQRLKKIIIDNEDQISA
ncbi:MAG TPA: DUF2339 domain-containing protein [Puia sp.]|jgi:uncharacterized membrane protein|nr:DUF2339 domain-containing protein [Puia sp.]